MTIFCKLRERLANHHKIYAQTQKETESIVASAPQLKENQTRIQSAAHVHLMTSLESLAKL